MECENCRIDNKGLNKALSFVVRSVLRLERLWAHYTFMVYWPSSTQKGKQKENLNGLVRVFFNIDLFINKIAYSCILVFFNQNNNIYFYLQNCNTNKRLKWWTRRLCIGKKSVFQEIKNSTQKKKSWSRRPLLNTLGQWLVLALLLRTLKLWFPCISDGIENIFVIKSLGRSAQIEEEFFYFPPINPPLPTWDLHFHFSFLETKRW